MKKQKNTIRLKFYLILLSMLFIGACSKDDSSSPDLPDTEGGSIHVTGDLAVQGDKVITDAEFEYDGQYGISFYIFGDDDQGGGFSMVLGGYFENPESVVETGSYTIAASGYILINLILEILIPIISKLLMERILPISLIWRDN